MCIFCTLPFLWWTFISLFSALVLYKWLVMTITDRLITTSMLQIFREYFLTNIFMCCGKICIISYTDYQIFIFKDLKYKITFITNTDKMLGNGFPDWLKKKKKNVCWIYFMQKPNLKMLFVKVCMMKTHSLIESIGPALPDIAMVCCTERWNKSYIVGRYLTEE